MCCTEILLLPNVEKNPCANNSCDETNSKCKNMGYDDYMCKCNKGFEEVPDTQWKKCRGIKIFSLISFPRFLANQLA